MPQAEYDQHTRHLGRMYLSELKKLHALATRREDIGPSWATSVELCAAKCDYQEHLLDEHRSLTVAEFDARCAVDMEIFEML